MKLIKNNMGFVCEHCGKEVLPVLHGSSRNHCPYCLYSKHVDEVPGDRKSICGGLMFPSGVKKHRSTWKILHQCSRCGKKIYTICAEDDNFEILTVL